MTLSVPSGLLRLLIVGACGCTVVAACAPGPPAAPAASNPPAAAATSAPAAAPTTAPVAASVARPAASPAAVPNAAPAGAGQSGPADQLPIVQSSGRMVIYTTDIAILAQDLGRVADQLGTLVLAHGGYVAGVETSSDSAGVPGVVVRLKVPPEQYEATMGGIRGMAVEVRSEKATTQDVTEEYSDTQAQISSLEAIHAQLLELIKRAGSVDELLKVQQQADDVRLQIDRLKGRATALERLSSLASIAVTAQLASAVLEQDFTVVLAAVRQSETQRAGLLAQLKRVRTPEEEAALRDKLGQVDLALQRQRPRLAALDAEATRMQIGLPRPDETAATTAADDTLAAAYVQTRVELRRAQADQKQVTADLQTGVPNVGPDRLEAAILRTNDLSLRLRTIQDRAGQVGITLPAVSPDEESAMAQVSAEPTREGLVAVQRAWASSLGMLAWLGSALVFVWWLLPLGLAAAFVVRRRRRV